jgi:hypothetical protein
VYKEEKQRGRKTRLKARQIVLDEIATEALERKNSKYKFIANGSGLRTLLGTVIGRKDGQPPVEKDEYGLPVIETAESAEAKKEVESEVEGDSLEKVEVQEASCMLDREAGDPGPSTQPTEDLSTAVSATEDAADGSTEGIGKPQDRKRVHESDSELEEPVAPKMRGPKKGHKKTAKKAWVVPEESDDSMDELGYMREKGLDIVHDYWPSPWRVMAATHVNEERINKTVRQTSRGPRLRT